MSVSAALMAALLVSVISLCIHVSASTVTCGPTPGFTCNVNPGGDTTNGYHGQQVWDFPSDAAGHNCTTYAAYRLVLNGLPTEPLGLGNASGWAAAAQSDGYLVDGNPRIGSIAWWPVN